MLLWTDETEIHLYQRNRLLIFIDAVTNDGSSMVISEVYKNTKTKTHWQFNKGRHHREKVEEFGPDLNPTEQIFHLLKRRLKRETPQNKIEIGIKKQQFDDVTYLQA